MAKKAVPKKVAGKPKQKDERAQRERFEEFARAHGATEEVLDKAMRQSVEGLKRKPEKQ